jgi:transposase-like protein
MINFKLIASELYDSLVSGQEELSGMMVKEITTEFMKQFIETCLEHEMKEFLSREKYEHHSKKEKKKRYRNGFTPKKIVTPLGVVDIAVPRDRNSSFQPTLVPKHQKDFAQLPEVIISLYARGMSQRDIALMVEDIYKKRISQATISLIIQSITGLVNSFRRRELDKLYPVVFIDGLYFPVKENNIVRKMCLYTMIGVTCEGQKECLGFWLRPTESAKEWQKIFKEIKSRGVEEINILCCDGLSGLKKVIEKEFPSTLIQRCVIHLVMNSLKYISNDKDIKQIRACFRRIYKANNEEEALLELQKTKEIWESKYKNLMKPWEQNWEDARLMFDFPIDVRRIFYTNNAVESYNKELRKMTKNKGPIANREALYRMCYLRTEELYNRCWYRRINKWRVIKMYFYNYFKDSTRNIQLLEL